MWRDLLLHGLADPGGELIGHPVEPDLEALAGDVEIDRRRRDRARAHRDTSASAA
jgi:hypothetical protein